MKDKQKIKDEEIIEKVMKNLWKNSVVEAICEMSVRALKEQGRTLSEAGDLIHQDLRNEIEAGIKEAIRLAKKSVFDDVDEDIFEPLNKRFSSRMELVMVSKLIGILERGFENIKKKHGVE